MIADDFAGRRVIWIGPADEEHPSTDQWWIRELERLAGDLRLANGRLFSAPLSPKTYRDPSEMRSSGLDAHEGRTKGAETVLYLTFATSAISTIASVLKLWLRERTRTIELTTIDETGLPVPITLTGAMSDETVRSLISRALEKNQGGTSDDGSDPA